jgi:two-component system chemotaxis response regulator CheY
MRILIAEDDFVSRRYITKVMSEFGECDVTVDGMEALDVFLMSLDEGKYYDLICLDIMMPLLDGVKALKTIRKLEEERNIPNEKRAKVIMTTALSNSEDVLGSFDSGSEAYAVKPLDVAKIKEVLRLWKLII